MKAIVAVDKKWGIGKKNDLLFSIPEDMKFFRKTTMDKVVVMGSNTLKSFPGSKPLPKRVNIVLWPDGEKREDCIVVNSLDELKATLKEYDDEQIFIIGGAMFYHTMLPYCSTVYVTKVNADGNAEVFFDNLDALDNWECVNEGEKIMAGEYEIRFTEYKNNDVKPL